MRSTPIAISIARRPSRRRSRSSWKEPAVAAGWGPLEAAETVGQLAIADRYCRQSKAFVDAYNMLDQVVAEHRS
jgi:hypothetical protein